MRLQFLSDLHLESESFDPEPAADAELLVLGGDIDSTWHALERFRGWPVPVLMVAGNHEFDGREIEFAWDPLRERCTALGIDLLEQDERLLVDRRGRRIRVLGTIRWCDFELFGPARRERCLRAGGYFARVMRATLDGREFDAAAVREEGLACRAWLEDHLRAPREDIDATLVITHFAPSLRSADPRFGPQPGTASFCNADDDLLPLADVWLHGHLHCRHDYQAGATRVVCQARGLASKGEAAGFEPFKLIEV
jgi:predicted phosphodiesterase